MPPEDVIGTLHQQLSQIAVSSFGDTELRISLSGLTPFRPQAEIATHIATSLENVLCFPGSGHRSADQAIILREFGKLEYGGSRKARQCALCGYAGCSADT